MSHPQPLYLELNWVSDLGCVKLLIIPCMLGASHSSLELIPTLGQVVFVFLTWLNESYSENTINLILLPIMHNPLMQGLGA